MKKSLKKHFSLSLCICAIICAMAIALSGCSGSGSVSKGKQLSVNEFYGLGSVSTVKLLGNAMSSNAINTFSLLSSDTLEGSDTSSLDVDAQVKEQAENFDKYFSALDSFLGDDTVSIVTEANTDEEFKDYATKMIINGVDANGQANVYVMYYNESAQTQDSSVDNDDDDDDDQEESEDEGEVESASVLDGVIVMNEVKYHLVGERSVESEIGESEEELKIRAFIDENPNNYVEMEQEISQENGETEIEYIYRIYEDLVLVEETSVEFENETEDQKNETEFELTFVKGQAKGAYEVEREIENGVTKIKVKYNVDGKRGNFTITKQLSADGATYEYTFADNTKTQFKHNK